MHASPTIACGKSYLIIDMPVNSSKHAADAAFQLSMFVATQGRAAGLHLSMADLHTSDNPVCRMQLTTELQ